MALHKTQQTSVVWNPSAKRHPIAVGQIYQNERTQREK